MQPDPGASNGQRQLSAILPHSRGRAFGALRRRDFRLLWIGQVISHLGGWMHHTAEAWLIYEMTGSPFLVGFTWLVRTIPFIVISLYAGTVVDRVDRRRLLIGVEGFNMIAVLALGVLVAGGWIAIWHIYAVSLLVGMVAAFEAPARSALLPHLVPAQDLMTAVGLQSAVRKGSQVIGPALGGIFIAAFGVAGAFFIHSGAYLVLVLCLLWMRTTNPIEPAGATHLGQALAEGFRYVYREKLIATLLLLQGAVSLFGSTQAMMVVFAREVFDTGPEGLGLLQSAVGLGAIVGSVALAALGDVQHKGRLLAVSGLLFCSSVVAFAFAPSFAAALPILALSGLTDMVFGSTKQTLIQMLAARSFLGRVMALNSISGRGLGQASGFQAGTLATLVGIREATAFGGLVCLGALLAARLAVPGLWRLAGTFGQHHEGREQVSLADERVRVNPLRAGELP